MKRNHCWFSKFVWIVLYEVVVCVFNNRRKGFEISHLGAVSGNTNPMPAWTPTRTCFGQAKLVLRCSEYWLVWFFSILPIAATCKEVHLWLLVCHSWGISRFPTHVGLLDFKKDFSLPATPRVWVALPHPIHQIGPKVAQTVSPQPIH